MNKVPWIALALLILSYSTLGWVLSESQAPWFAWIVIILTILLLVGMLAAPYSTIARYSSVFLSSNTRAFLVTMLGAFLLFIVLAWFRVFLDILLVIAAGILARIDFQSVGWKTRQAFVATSIFSIAGIGLGAFTYDLLKQHLIWQLIPLRF
ncbi:hypothetical protein FD725_14145 [Nostoc sp. TCL26-01]|nr:hypothetical protein FD725_14145 [Nostoc sp. TCL26-01]